MTGDESARTRLRIGAGCALLVGIAFIQAPGFQVADTKFDLVVDPWGFLSRALHLWDPLGAFGQLQNQAYGYLWPMGPFFLLGDLLQLPGWVVQRSWLALVLCVAFVGMARLSRAMGVRSDLACLVAGFAYATSPRILSIVGAISIEAWPSALAPWVLLPLVLGAYRGSPRRMAMFSGLAVAMVGGVNAAATAAVLPLGAIWLLTRTPGPRRRALMVWWPVFTAMGTLWWLVPLFLMGAYSPPFLDYIESASVTTFPTTLFDALRGTTAWVPYVEPAWQAGYEVITTSYLALNSGILLVLGAAGLLSRSTPHRQFLLVGLLAGLFLVTMGHDGSVQGWFAGPLQASLDGVLAPVRNVHKFDPVIRIPMVIGLAWLLEATLRSATTAERVVRGRRFRLVSSRPVVALALVGLVGASLPALAGTLAPARPVLATPQYWHQAVDWLDERTGRAVSLLAPGSSFASYLWGAPRDEPIQYLAGSRWAVRNAIPLAPEGNIRMLDAFEERLARGKPSPGLARYLRRAGVMYVVVRNDLQQSGDVPHPVLVHRAIEQSPGFSRVATFGPPVGGQAHLRSGGRRVVINGGWQARHPAIEVYAVAGDVPAAVGASRLPVVVGGPEDLLDLLDLGLVHDEPTQLAIHADTGSPPESDVVLTDGMLDRERFFGRVHDGASAVSTPGAVRRSGNPVKGFELGPGSRWLTTAVLLGAESISASSSLADSRTPGGSQPGHLPYAAVDEDRSSSWISGAAADEDPWWRIELDGPRALQQVTITLGADSQVRDGLRRLRVRTGSGGSEIVHLEAGRTRTVELDGGPTTWLEVRAVDTGRLSLAEVEWDGGDVRRPLVLPDVPEAWGSPDTVVLRSLLDPRTGCVPVGEHTPCRLGHARAAEEPNGFDRLLTVPSDQSYRSELTARPVAGPELLDLLQTGGLLEISSSSTGVPDLRASALAAIDGDPGTSWTAALDDERPQLRMNWIRQRRIDRVRAVVDPAAPVRAPTELLLSWPDGEREVELDRQGRATFPPIRTDRLTIRVLGTDGAVSVDAAGGGEDLPIGISELRVRGLGLEPVAITDTERRWRCGTGPTLEVNGDLRRTALVASPRELYEGRTVPVDVCGAPRVVLLEAGTNALRSSASDVAVADTLVLVASDRPVDVAPAAVSGDGVTSVRIDPEPGSEVVALRQNVNPGWQAEQAGEALEPVIVDGWQQGWRTDGSGRAIVATFAPDAVYRTGLAGGALSFLLLLLLPLVPARRWPGTGLPALAGERLTTSAMIALALLGGGVLAGWPGVAVSVVGVVLGGVVVRRHPDGVSWFLAVLPGLAAFGYFLRPWGSPDGWAGAWAWPHYLVLLTVSGALVVAARRSDRRFRRIAGSSMSR